MCRLFAAFTASGIRYADPQGEFRTLDEQYAPPQHFLHIDSLFLSAMTVNCAASSYFLLLLLLLVLHFFIVFFSPQI